MYSLIRFFEKKEYLDDFLSGHLYMSSIGHFWQLGQPHAQDDLFEGVFETLSVEEVDKRYKADLKGTFGSNILLPIMNRLEGYQFVHILCFYLHAYDPKHKLATKIPESIKGLGKYAVRIRDVQGFVDKIYEKVKSEQLYGLMGPVTYHQPTEKLEYMDCFDKSITHQHEHEWRFALIPDFEKAKKDAEEMRKTNAERIGKEDADGMPLTYEEHIYFEVGDLRSIAEEIDAEGLIADAGKQYGEGYRTVDSLPYTWAEMKKLLEVYHRLGLPIPYQAYPEQYVGWMPRQAFRNKVMEIDNGVKPLMTIG